MAVPLVAPGPGANGDAIIQSHNDAITDLQYPNSPVQLPVIDTAANLLFAAPAANWPNCTIVVTDKSCVAVSVLIAGTWTWVRTNGGAL